MSVTYSTVHQDLITGSSLLDKTLAAARRDQQMATPDGEQVRRLTEGVSIRYLPVHTDLRGSVCELFDTRWGRHEEPLVFAYCFTIRPGVVKGWNLAQGARGPVRPASGGNENRVVRSAAGIRNLWTNLPHHADSESALHRERAAERLARRSQHRIDRRAGRQLSDDVLRPRESGQEPAADWHGLDPHSFGNAIGRPEVETITPR